MRRKKLWRKEIHARRQRKKSERKEMQNYFFISFKIGFHVVLSRSPSSLFRLLG
jgi:hypothetical protein